MQHYHVTEKNNLAGILSEGLKPHLGPRSAECGEAIPRIYLFSTKAACEDALMGWLGDAFADASALAIIEISNLDPAFLVEDGFEVTCEVGIPARYISQVFDEAFSPTQLRQPA